jgi:transcriptional regulator with XRE-family HTH domain
MSEYIALRHLVGENIRYLRKARGLTQEELGEQAELSYKFVGEVERGSVNPSLDSLAGIATALKVDIVKLFGNADQIVLSGNDISSVQNALATIKNTLELNQSN